MSLILGANVPIESIVYNDMFLILEQRIIKQHQLIAKMEGIGNEPDLKKLEKYLYALNYSYLLYSLTDFQTIDYWKDRLSYEEIKSCFLSDNIDLDSLINTFI